MRDKCLHGLPFRTSSSLPRTSIRRVRLRFACLIMRGQLKPSAARIRYGADEMVPQSINLLDQAKPNNQGFLKLDYTFSFR